MRMLHSDSPFGGLPLRGVVLLTLLLAPALGAQERDVVSKEVAVGRSEASLRLEVEDVGELEILLEDGTLWIDGEAVGSYEPGDALDAAFRTLLGDAVSLDDGPLSEMLREWSPPDELDGDARALARRIDDALEQALAGDAGGDPRGDVVSVTFGSGDGESLVGLLLGRLGRLGVLEDALEELDDVEFHVEDVVVEADRTVVGSLVVLQGDARIEGTVTDDVVLVGGTLELGPNAEVGGDIRIADGTLADAGARIEGAVVDLLDDERDEAASERSLRDEIRAELRSELRNELRDEIRQTSRRDRGYALVAPFRGVFGALGGLFQNLVAVLVLGLVGMGLLAFAGPNLDAVAETARKAPGRAAVVGMAGTFLLIPVWVVGVVALAVSIIGIPVLVAWVPLFPVAAVAAGVMGYIAVARNAGEWLADSGYRWTDWIRRENAVYTIFGGLLGLVGFFILANVLRVVPFLGFLRGFLAFAGMVVTFMAVMIGFGAVLLTRAGRRPEYYPLDPEEAWRRAVEVDVEVEVSDAGDAAPEGPEAEAAVDVDVEVEEEPADSAPAAPESPAAEAEEAAAPEGAPEDAGPPEPAAEGEETDQKSEGGGDA